MYRLLSLKENGTGALKYCKRVHTHILPIVKYYACTYPHDKEEKGKSWTTLVYMHNTCGRKEERKKKC